MWLTSSYREMSSREVAAIVAFPFVEDVLRICTSVLVTVIDGNIDETIKLAHFTVKEFLVIQQGYDDGLYWYRFTAQLAHCCISDLAIGYILESPTTPQIKDLRQYGSRFWLMHAKQNDMSTDWADVQVRIDSIFSPENDGVFRDWLENRYPSEKKSWKQPLYYASLLGILASVKTLRQKLSPQDDKHELLGNAVTAAARMGHVDIVKWLVEQCDDITFYVDLPLILESIQVNVRETLFELLHKGPRIPFTVKAMFAATKNHAGAEIIGILMDYELVSIAISEDLVKAAARSRLDCTVLDTLIRRRVAEIPLGLRTLLTIAKTSRSALKSITEHHKSGIHFVEHDYLVLAQERSTITIHILLFHGVTIPVTQGLLKALAKSPYGSNILRILVDKQKPLRPLTDEALYTIAECFDLEIFRTLINDDWKERVITEGLIRAIAHNCYLEPPKRPEYHEGLSGDSDDPDEDFNPRRHPRRPGMFQGTLDNSVHKDHRPILRKAGKNIRSSILRSLVDGAGPTFPFTRSVLRLVTDHFDIKTFVFLMDKLFENPALAPIFKQVISQSSAEYIRAQALECGIPEETVDLLASSWQLGQSRSNSPDNTGPHNGGRKNVSDGIETTDMSGKILRCTDNLERLDHGPNLW